LTDVEQEMNGLLTYDRIPKVEPAKIAQANRFELPLPKYVPLVPTSEASQQMWRYTIDNPQKEWNREDFDDSGWTESRGGFGNLPERTGTPWTSEGIWIRRHFNASTLSERQSENLVADDMHLGDIQIYINGVLAYSQGKNSLSFEHRGLTKEARAAVRPNSDNVIAVHCVRRGDQQWVDAGLDVRIPQDR